jgi:hypothetical protein
MRVYRVQLSTRSLQLAIAALAVLLGAGLAELRRRSDYNDRLNFHYQQLEGSSPPLASGFWNQLSQADQARYIKGWMHHAAMAKQYETALSIPLFFVPSDIPEP